MRLRINLEWDLHDTSPELGHFPFRFITALNEMLTRPCALWMFLDHSQDPSRNLSGPFTDFWSIHSGDLSSLYNGEVPLEDTGLTILQTPEEYFFLPRDRDLLSRELTDLTQKAGRDARDEKAKFPCLNVQLWGPSRILASDPGEKPTELFCLRQAVPHDKHLYHVPILEWRLYFITQEHRAAYCCCSSNSYVYSYYTWELKGGEYYYRDKEPAECALADSNAILFAQSMKEILERSAARLGYWGIDGGRGGPSQVGTLVSAVGEIFGPPSEMSGILD